MLNELRKEIDQIDEKIVKLINERYKHVIEIGHLKQRTSREIYVPEREKALLGRLEKLNKGPMSPQALRAIYREVMSGAISLEKPLTIGFFGPEASFTHLAALSKFGHCAKYVPKSGISDVFNDVETERIDYGVVPIENSTEGAVNHTLDMLVNSSAKICAEINTRIHHNLLAKCPMSKIRKVYSHAQIFGQCRSWLQEHLPGVETIESSSSTKASKVAAEEKYSAAISSTLAAELYKLDIVADNIEDNADNTTRFLVLGWQEPRPTGDDKTSICYAIKDRVGALYDSLLPFKNEKVTLTMIESRPSKRRNWEYYFFLDFHGHHEDPAPQKALKKLKYMCQFVRILGSYPRSRDIL
ncbi:MAG TPA: prephenate dehydratase [Lentisphaeria bacterium]|nr:MAG: chorismate mutase [Lentisphaerae bacterium GWF2_49_21]HBC87474.1 prephenate dehydratase [Lentisphaeria bacterium]